MNKVENFSTIEKELEAEKRRLEGLKNSLNMELYNLQKEESIIDNNIYYFEMYLKNLSQELNESDVPIENINRELSNITESNIKEESNEK